jgi:hypothetical protein
MRRVLRFPFITISLLLCAVPACATPDLAFERGTAITEPYALRELDHHRFDLGRLLAPARSADQPLTNDQLFALPSMAPLRKALDEDFKRYIANERAHYPSDASSSTTRCSIRPTRASCSAASSAGWTAHMCRAPIAAKSA